MCSLGGLAQVKTQLARIQSTNSTTCKGLSCSNADDGMIQWCAGLALLGRLVAYITVLGLIVLIIFVILKYVAECDDVRSNDEIRATETSPLRAGKTVSYSYGGAGEKDLESGDCSGSNSSSGNGCSEELYDGKLCVICYDEERNCFFVPCGHCATCHDCANRIYKGENKVCPVCRRFIGKVRRLFVA